MKHAHRRIWSVDIVRGVYIFLMMTAHSIFFFHAKTNPLLQSLNGFADTVTFTGLLLLSGVGGYIAYIHRDHPTGNVIKRVTKRLFIYLLGYYLLSIVAGNVNQELSVARIFNIMTFQELVPFTEFILPFLILGIAKIPFRPLYLVVSRSLTLTLIFSALSAIPALLLSQFKIGFLPASWQAIVIGLPGIYSFPILSYLPAYFLGVYIGRMYWNQTKPQRTTILRLLTVFTGITSLVLVMIGSVLGSSPFTLFERWPPTLPFILFGITVVTAVLVVIELLSNLQRTPWIRNLLIIFGQNAFALFFTHTLVIYLYRASGLPLIHSSLLVLTLYIASILIALYLARIIPLNYRLSLTFFRWCDCQWGVCTHAQEHHLVVSIKRLILTAVNLPRIFSFKLGRHRITPLKVRHSLLLIGIFFLTAAPLGIAENQLLVQNLFTQLSGTLNRTWVIPDRTQNLIYTISLPDSVDPDLIQSIHYEVNGNSPQSMSAFGRSWTAAIPIHSFNPGEYQVHALITLNNSQFHTRPTTFYITQPVYVTWTIDWEGYDAPDSYLDAMITIAEKYQLPMTHFFNPRIYTAPDIDPVRAEYLTQWVINRRDIYQEEIGLHLHMFKDFVESAGLEPKDEPNWSDGSGYDILTTAYSTDDLITLITHAKEWFDRYRLGIPRSYRAGGWFASSATLKALEATGFYADSSARTKYTFGSKNIPGFWDITPTTSPYFPSEFNQNSPDPEPRLSLLEIPNNGADTYAFSAQDMLDRFTANYSGGVSRGFTQVTFLSHPHWFNTDRQQKIRQVLDAVDQFSYQDDRGPVIYTTVSGVYQAWINQ